MDIPGTERGGLCSYSPTSPGGYRLVAEISIDGERGYYSRENTLTVEGEPPSGGTGTVGTELFSIPARGGWSTTSSETAETLRVGYGRIRADAGSTTSGVRHFGILKEMTKADIQKQALALPEADQIELAHTLLDNTTPSLTEAQEMEVTRRIKATGPTRVFLSPKKMP